MNRISLTPALTAKTRIPSMKTLRAWSIPLAIAASDLLPARAGARPNRSGSEKPHRPTRYPGRWGHYSGTGVRQAQRGYEEARGLYSRKQTASFAVGDTPNLSGRAKPRTEKAKRRNPGDVGHQVPGGDQGRRFGQADGHAPKELRHVFIPLTVFLASPMPRYPRRCRPSINSSKSIRRCECSLASTDTDNLPRADGFEDLCR